MHLGGNTQTLEDLPGARLRHVAVVLEDDLFECRIALAVEFLIGPGQQLVLLAHRREQLLVAGHHRLQDRIALVAEVILTEHAEPRPLGHRHRPVVGELLTREDTQQRRLARPVGPHQAVPMAVGELKRDVLEQGLVADTTWRDRSPRSWGGENNTPPVAFRWFAAYFCSRASAAGERSRMPRASTRVSELQK